VLQVLLARLTGQTDILVGSPVAHRPRSEVEGLIGMFFNFLAHRLDLADDPAFSVALERCRGAAFAAFDHQDLPFEVLLDELALDRDLSRTPLFQVTLVLQNRGLPVEVLPDLEVAPIELDRGLVNFDCNLQLAELPEGVGGWLEYRADLFDATT